MSNSKLAIEFRNVVATVFDSWTALQLAVANGPGGCKGQEIVTNMIDGITKLISENENIDSYEVADVLHDMMDENFQTICEDNSPEEVGAVLCQYFIRCRSGDKHLVDSELNNVKRLSAHASQKNPSQCVNSEGGAASEPVDVSIDAGSPHNNDDMEVEDSEWTTVRSKRRT